MLGRVLFGFALIVQVLLPVMASRMLAQALDPFAHPVICAVEVPNHDGPAAPPPIHCQHCPLCQAGHVVTPPVLPPVAVAARRPAPMIQCAWVLPPARAPPRPLGHIAPARGPPALV